MHKDSKEILQEIKDAKSKITIGSSYTHYKDPNKTYVVKGFGTLEADDSLCVIYQAQYGDKLTFIRSATEWLDQVQWQGKIVPRFKKLWSPQKQNCSCLQISYSEPIIHSCRKKILF